MTFAPTPEQQAIYEAFDAGHSIVIQARAGTGKTTTMVGIGNRTKKRGTYIVYNAKAKEDAKERFGKNVTVKTSHGLAYMPMMRKFGYTYPEWDARLRAARTPRKELCAILGIVAGMGDQDTFLAPTKLAGFVTETVRNFCYSDSSSIVAWHVPKVAGTEDYRDEFVSFCIEKANAYWSQVFDKNSRLKLEHDHYLKAFALDNPKLTGDFVILDEAQDSNPCVAQIVNNQTHMQRIMVGDSCQAIYGWRGAVDALAYFEADVTLYLSKSFRFGPAVAEEANKWLTLLGETVMLEGHEPVKTTVGPMELLPDGCAILCRTNAAVMTEALEAQEAGKRVAIVGGAQTLMAYAEAAIDLMAGKGTWHHELLAFKTWTAVQNYCIEEKEEAGSLAVMVKIIDAYTPERIIEMCKRCTNENDADVILSTAHKAKGAEWDYVRISDDFAPTTENEPMPSRESMMLAYVAVTRAKKQLDNLGLSFVDSLIQPEMEA